MMCGYTIPNNAMIYNAGDNHSEWICILCNDLGVFGRS